MRVFDLPNGPYPVYVSGHRIHHGLAGCFLIGLGLLLALHDRRDWRVWWRDFRITRLGAL